MNMQVTYLLNKSNISLIELHKQLIKEFNNNKELESVIEEGEDIAVKSRFSIKRQLKELIKDRNTEKDNELLALNKLGKAAEELYNDSFKEIQLN